MQKIKKQVIVAIKEQLFCDGRGLATDQSLEECYLHPRVYLDLSNKKVTNCCYCKMEYLLV